MELEHKDKINLEENDETNEQEEGIETPSQVETLPSRKRDWGERNNIIKQKEKSTSNSIVISNTKLRKYNKSNSENNESENENDSSSVQEEYSENSDNSDEEEESVKEDVKSDSENESENEKNESETKKIFNNENKDIKDIKINIKDSEENIKNKIANNNDIFNEVINNMKTNGTKNESILKRLDIFENSIKQLYLGIRNLKMEIENQNGFHNYINEIQENHNEIEHPVSTESKYICIKGKKNQKEINLCKNNNYINKKRKSIEEKDDLLFNDYQFTKDIYKI